MPHDIYVPTPKDVGRPARPGDKVVVEPRQWESRHTNPEGEIIEVLGPPTAEAVKAVMAASSNTLAYCRSGTRSVTAWALAEASEGVDPEDIVDRAQEVGYNLSGMRGQLRRIAQR